MPSKQSICVASNGKVSNPDSSKAEVKCSSAEEIGKLKGRRKNFKEKIDVLSIACDSQGVTAGLTEFSFQNAWQNRAHSKV